MGSGREVEGEGGAVDETDTAPVSSAPSAMLDKLSDSDRKAPSGNIAPPPLAASSSLLLSLYQQCFPSTLRSWVHVHGTRPLMSAAEGEMFSLHKVSLPRACPYRVAESTSNVFTMFVFDKRAPGAGGLLQCARNAVENTKMMRHPWVLQYRISEETPEEIIMLTEAVVPLKYAAGSIHPMLFRWLVFQLATALSFLHSDCGYSHNNLSSAAMYVTTEGPLELRLGGMEYSGRESDEGWVREMRRYRRAIAVPPEEVGGATAIKDRYGDAKMGQEINMGQARDVWAFSGFLTCACDPSSSPFLQLFDRNQLMVQRLHTDWNHGKRKREEGDGESSSASSRSTTTTPSASSRSTTTTPSSLDRDLKQWKPLIDNCGRKNPTTRWSMHTVLQSPLFLDDPLVSVNLFLHNIALKTATMKDVFFKKLPSQLEPLPETVILDSVLPKVLSPIILREPSVHDFLPFALQPARYISPELTEQATEADGEGGEGLEEKRDGEYESQLGEGALVDVEVLSNVGGGEGRGKGKGKAKSSDSEREEGAISISQQSIGELETHASTPTPSASSTSSSIPSLGHHITPPPLSSEAISTRSTLVKEAGSGLLGDGKYRAFIIPFILNNYLCDDRNTRLALLYHLPVYLMYLDLPVVRKQVFSRVLIGLQDSSRLVVKTTVCAIDTIITFLHSLGDVRRAEKKLLKACLHIANLALHDHDAHIRCYSILYLAHTLTSPLSAIVNKKLVYYCLTKSLADQSSSLCYSVLHSLCETKHVIPKDVFVRKLLPSTTSLLLHPSPRIQHKAHLTILVVLRHMYQADAELLKSGAGVSSVAIQTGEEEKEIMVPRSGQEDPGRILARICLTWFPSAEPMVAPAHEGLPLPTFVPRRPIFEGGLPRLENAPSFNWNHFRLSRDAIKYARAAAQQVLAKEGIDVLHLPPMREDRAKRRERQERQSREKRHEEDNIGTQRLKYRVNIPEMGSDSREERYPQKRRAGNGHRGAMQDRYGTHQERQESSNRREMFEWNPATNQKNEMSGRNEEGAISGWGKLDLDEDDVREKDATWTDWDNFSDFDEEEEQEKKVGKKKPALGKGLDVTSFSAHLPNLFRSGSSEIGVENRDMVQKRGKGGLVQPGIPSKTKDEDKGRSDKKDGEEEGEEDEEEEHSAPSAPLLASANIRRQGASTSRRKLPATKTSLPFDFGDADSGWEDEPTQRVAPSDSLATTSLKRSADSIVLLPSTRHAIEQGDEKKEMKKNRLTLALDDGVDDDIAATGWGEFDDEDDIFKDISSDDNKA